MGVKAFIAPVMTLLAALPAAARADVVGAAGSTLADAVIVGSGGELWRRGEGGVWTRRAGGVAATLVVAGGGAGNDVWAMGPAAPPYHHDGVTWFALPIAPGGAGVLAGVGSLPAVALGRRVLLLGREDGRPRWLELGALPPAAGEVTALWVSAPRDAVAATADGTLWRLSGGWKQQPAPPLDAGERVVAFARAGRSLVALGSAGTLLAIDGRARKLAFHAGRMAGGARVLVLGETDAGVTALARIDKDKVVPVAPAPPLDAGDSVVAILPIGADGALVATSRGKVLVATGGEWTTETIDDHPPAEPPHATDPPAELAR